MTLVTQSVCQYVCHTFLSQPWCSQSETTSGSTSGLTLGLILGLILGLTLGLTQPIRNNLRVDPFFLWSRNHYKDRGVITSMVQEELKDIYKDKFIYIHMQPIRNNLRINLRVDPGVDPGVVQIWNIFSHDIFFSLEIFSALKDLSVLKYINLIFYSGSFYMGSFILELTVCNF